MSWRRLYAAPQFSPRSFHRKMNATEINVVTSQKLIKTTPQRVSTIVRAKGGPTPCVSFFCCRAAYVKHKKMLYKIPYAKAMSTWSPLSNICSIWLRSGKVGVQVDTLSSLSDPLFCCRGRYHCAVPWPWGGVIDLCCFFPILLTVLVLSFYLFIYHFLINSALKVLFVWKWCYCPLTPGWWPLASCCRYCCPRSRGNFRAHDTFALTRVVDCTCSDRDLEGNTVLHK